VTTAVVKGEPSETILEYVDDHDVDVITMGTHGRTGLNRYIAGSVTERVVPLADVPVLTVVQLTRASSWESTMRSSSPPMKASLQLRLSIMDSRSHRRRALAFTL
jgi:K+-sensing histidine kinase KdpD